MHTAPKLPFCFVCSLKDATLVISFGDTQNPIIVLTLFLAAI
jgi:hypothetical protein